MKDFSQNIQCRLVITVYGDRFTLNQKRQLKVVYLCLFGGKILTNMIIKSAEFLRTPVILHGQMPLMLHVTSHQTLQTKEFFTMETVSR